ncbi:unnamed protein product [Musa hybrid cultivar]
MQLLPHGLFLVLPPCCPRRPSLNSLPSHRLTVSNRGTNVKPRAIRCCHFYTARCTCRLQLMCLFKMHSKEHTKKKRRGVL